MANNLLVLFTLATQTYGLPPGLINAVCFVESAHRTHVVHKNDGGEDSHGVCQVKLSTAKDLGFNGTHKQLMKPEINIHYAAKYLHHQIQRCRSVGKGVIAYNRGHCSQKTEYLHKVLEAYAQTY